MRTSSSSDSTCSVPAWRGFGTRPDGPLRDCWALSLCGPKSSIGGTSAPTKRRGSRSKAKRVPQELPVVRDVGRVVALPQSDDFFEAAAQPAVEAVLLAAGDLA